MAVSPSTPTLAPFLPPDLLQGLGSFGDHGAAERAFRDRLALFYRAQEGLRSSGPTEAAYEVFLFPHDVPGWRHRYADEAWSCALRFLAVCRLLRIPHPLLNVPYASRIGQAVSDAGVVGRAYGSLVERAALRTYAPDVADTTCMRGGSGPHVSCIVAAEDAPAPYTGRVLIAVDGGQGRRNAMAIEENRYLWQPGPPSPPGRPTITSTLRSIEAPRSIAQPGATAPLIWVIDCWRLVLNAGLLAA